MLSVPRVATSAKPISTKRRQVSVTPGLSASRTETKTVPLKGSEMPLPSCDFAKARPKSASSPMTSPVERISGPRIRSTPGKRLNGKTASLTATWPDRRIVMSKSARVSPAMTPGRDLGDRHAGRLGDERHGAAGPGIDLQDVDIAVLDRELHVHQTDHAEGQRHCRCLLLDLGDDRCRERVGRKRAGAVAGMNAASSICSMMPAI